MDGAKCTATKGFTFGGLKLIDPAMVKIIMDDIYKIEPFFKNESDKKASFQAESHFQTASSSLETFVPEQVCIKGTQSVNTTLLTRFKVGADDLAVNST
jgi:hypothetical protein